MKHIKILFFAIVFAPFTAFAAGNDFQMAAQLLAAAKNADIQQVQALVNNGANVNYVDSTGVSVVCTALMNNDIRAAQILQMYGADASKCDKQIKAYRTRTQPKSDGGLFSGLSSAHGIVLAAAGAAVVVGGLYMLTDVFDGGNHNGHSGDSSGSRGKNGGTSSDDTTGATAQYTLPAGPGSSENTVALYNTDLYQPYFDAMADNNGLMMTYAYNAFIRGYTGMRTIRTNTNAPFDLSALTYTGDTPGGSRPVAVALVTKGGVNPTDSLGDGFMTWLDAESNSITYIAAKCAQDATACPTYVNAAIARSRKFYNRTSLADLADVSENDEFDLTGHGTVFGDGDAAADSGARIVAGWESGSAGVYGFIPNGQLGIYRAGDGYVMNTTVGETTDNGTAGVWDTLDTFTIAGKTYAITETATTYTNSVFTATDTSDENNTITGTIDGSGLRFAVDDIQYEALLSGNVNSLAVSDIWTFRAMLDAAKRTNTTNHVFDVIANLSLHPNSAESNYPTVDGFLRDVGLANLTTDAQIQATYRKYIDDRYNLDTSNDDDLNLPSLYAVALYKSVGTNQAQIIVNSTGAYNMTTSSDIQTATFDNYAPELYSEEGLEHLFMSVVAVKHKNGTSSVDAVADYTGGDNNTGKIVLSTWGDMSARICGRTTSGVNSISVDPWCFAAPGDTATDAVASMAGAVGLVKSAFPYMDNQKIFVLLALTADGPNLGTNPNTGLAWATDGTTANTALVSYLRGRYTLPGDLENVADSGYLDAFRTAFGYGLINLERATKPETSVYYASGIATSGKRAISSAAYWRAAAITALRPSAVLNPRAATLHTNAYDVLVAADGNISLPRVWQNDFSFGGASRHSLYMGDVLGELRTNTNNRHRTTIGDIGFTMNVSERNVADNMGGLDSMQIDFTTGNWNFATGYQNHMTDGASRFRGLNNPVLGLASNAVVTDAEYNMGRVTMGARAFSGYVTDDGLLENDPAISSMYVPAHIGNIYGGGANVALHGDKFGIATSVGNVHETNTVLGAYFDGLLGMGSADTIYVDTELKYAPTDWMNFTVRGTYARTRAGDGEFGVLQMSDIDSNAFAIGTDIGGFSFVAAMPLSVWHGNAKYTTADYDIVSVSDSRYDIAVNQYDQILDLRPDAREYRFSAEYRHTFGEFTDGAVGFIYRVNPNHTSEFGNESIFMLKMSHRVGI